LMVKMGMRMPVLLAGLLATIGWLLALTFPTSMIFIILLLCVISFGTTMLNAAIPNLVVAAVPENRTSEAIGAMSVFRGMAQAIGSQIVAVMLAVGAVSMTEGGSLMPSPISFRITIAWIAGLTLAAALAAYLLQPRPEEDEAGAEAARAA
ncbi:MAG: MFS transporter, partial [Sphingomonadales bacterium]